MEEEMKMSENTQIDDQVKIVDELRQKHKQELAEKDAKYNELFKQYVNKVDTVSSDADSTQKEPSMDELKKEKDEACKLAMTGNKKLSNLENAKLLLKAREYELKASGRDILLGDEKNFSESDLKNAEKTAELLQYAIDNCEGDSDIFSTLYASKLVENLR